ncbi:DUF7660 family protein [Mucilaginibacter terrae]|uniref:DUF7660 domain-containing protein n=1 Tax=Mucilaginibacter terrae TaxID=1955052 RepID=A0ABU3GTA9_9SPHI|nr:hypothetical protein [Mucilaginibacter terrae]MDT3403018.1 hypothetical protein [Mucilaginibacter terrae]
MQPSDVTDRASFILFINTLEEEVSSINPSEHPNPTMADFIEAIGRYTEDIQGYYDNTGQSINADVSTWRVFADILKGATMYE